MTIAKARPYRSGVDDREAARMPRKRGKKPLSAG
jgi:hypothetical protein